MITIPFAFWFLVIFFGIIGAFRGWAKEILASFSVILAIFVITVLQSYLPFVLGLFRNEDQFWLKALIVIILTIFGYQTPNFPQFSGKTRGERFQDRLLGFILGVINGYLIVGTIWYYLDAAKYIPLVNYVQVKDLPAQYAKQINDAISQLIPNMPPARLDGPAIYITVAISFIFLIIVFI